MKIAVVSACLVGLHTRYNGMDGYDEGIENFIGKYILIPLCPEQMGGLPTPRPRATLMKNGRVVNERGEDVTDFFMKGAEEIASFCKKYSIKTAILKEGSPSCGVKFTNIGWKRRKGKGILTRMLEKKGIRIIGI